MTLEPQNFAAGPLIQEAVRHFEAGRLSDAESLCNRVLQSKPDEANAVYLLGEISRQYGKLNRAVELMERAVILKPGNPFFLNNLGEILRELERPADAELMYRRALALKPDFIKAHNNLGNALQSLHRYDEAGRCYNEAIDLDPALALPRLNLGLMHLLLGEYGAGFELYEHRFEGADVRQTVVIREVLGKLKGTPRWQGQPLDGKRILIWTEQGLGDCIMMARYLPLLASRGAGAVMVLCATPLVRLMRTVDGVEDAISLEDDWSEESFAVHCPLMSLPFLFQTTLATVPAAVPYVRVAESMQRKWESKLEAIPRPRVGLVWAGGKRTAGEARRSMTLADFAPVLDNVGAGFVSLQKGADAAELRGVRWPIVDCIAECDDLMDTAGLIGQLDLVISIDTSVAHLAGALGKPVWVLVRNQGAWQWMLDREDSPWYPTMRIFRPSHDGGWPALMADIASRLESTFRAADGGKTAAAGDRRLTAKNSIWTRLFSKRAK